MQEELSYRNPQQNTELTNVLLQKKFSFQDPISMIKATENDTDEQPGVEGEDDQEITGVCSDPSGDSVSQTNPSNPNICMSNEGQPTHDFGPGQQYMSGYVQSTKRTGKNNKKHLQNELYNQNSSNELTVITSAGQIMQRNDSISSESIENNCGGKATEVFVWGQNKSGQLGLESLNTVNIGKNGSQTTKNSQGLTSSKLPRSITFNLVIEQVSCGDKHTALITQEGWLYTMGSNSKGQLGLGSSYLPSAAQPQLVDNLSHIQQVSCGSDFTIAIQKCSSHPKSQIIYSWGSNKYGQLALGSNKVMAAQRKVHSPTAITDFDEIPELISSVSCGAQHSLFLTSSGEVIACGNNQLGQCGFSPQECQRTAVAYKVAYFDQIEVFQIGAGSTHSLFLSVESQVYQTGNGHDLPTKVQWPLVGQTEQLIQIDQICCGSQGQSAAVSSEGDLYLWGTGTTPIKNETISSQVQEAVMSKTMGMVLDQNGMVWAWGRNEEGELGLGDNEPRDHPVPLLTLKTHQICQIQCGHQFTIALGQIKKIKPPKQQRRQRSVQPVIKPEQQIILLSESEVQFQTTPEAFQLQNPPHPHPQSIHPNNIMTPQVQLKPTSQKATKPMTKQQANSANHLSTIIKNGSSNPLINIQPSQENNGGVFQHNLQLNSTKAMQTLNPLIQNQNSNSQNFIGRSVSSKNRETRETKPPRPKTVLTPNTDYNCKSMQVSNSGGGCAVNQNQNQTYSQSVQQQDIIRNNDPQLHQLKSINASLIDENREQKSIIKTLQKVNSKQVSQQDLKLIQQKYKILKEKYTSQKSQLQSEKQENVNLKNQNAQLLQQIEEMAPIQDQMQAQLAQNRQDIEEREILCQELIKEIEEHKKVLKHAEKIQNTQATKHQSEVEFMQKQIDKSKNKEKDIVYQSKNQDRIIDELKTQVERLTIQNQEYEQINWQYQQELQKIHSKTARENYAQFLNKVPKLQSVIAPQQQQVNDLKNQSRDKTLTVVVDRSRSCDRSGEQFANKENQTPIDDRASGDRSQSIEQLQQHQQESRILMMNDTIDNIKSQLNKSSSKSMLGDRLQKANNKNQSGHMRQSSQFNKTDRAILNQMNSLKDSDAGCDTIDHEIEATGPANNSQFMQFSPNQQHMGEQTNRGGNQFSPPVDSHILNSSVISEIPRQRTNEAPHLKHLQLRSNYNEKLLQQLEKRTWVQRPWCSQGPTNRRSNSNCSN